MQMLMIQNKRDVKSNRQAPEARKAEHKQEKQAREAERQHEKEERLGLPQAT